MQEEAEQLGHQSLKHLISKETISPANSDYLIGRQTVQRTKLPWHGRHQLAKVAQHRQISKNFIVFGPEK